MAEKNQQDETDDNGDPIVPLELYSRLGLEVADLAKFEANTAKANKQGKDICVLCGCGVGKRTIYMINVPDEVAGGWQRIGTNCAKIPALKPYIMKER